MSVNRLKQNSAQDDGQILRYTPEGYIEVNFGDEWITYHHVSELFDDALANGGIATEALNLYREQVALWDKEEAERLRQQGLN